ncbi:MAG: PEGA domain-containing protein [Acidobacteriota bacterium]
MKFNKITTFSTIFLFLFFVISGSYSGVFPETEKEDNDISKLLKNAEENYQTGNFKKAIGIYEQIIFKLNKKKELVETKQKLFRTMISLSLTLFTIQETDKARTQLEKLIQINPNQTLDKEIYPPNFLSIFKEVQKKNLGSMVISAVPLKAVISVNGKSYGNSPVKIENFIKGEHIITAYVKGYNPYSQKVIVKENSENKFDIQLVKKKGEKIVEKTAQIKPKKKKKSSALLIVGGVLALGAILLLALKKKKEDPPAVLVKEFYNGEATEILPWLPSVSLLEVFGIHGRVENVEFEVRVNHPSIEDLSVALVGTDNRTVFSIWNKGEHRDGGRVFTGSTQIFNSIEPNGNWKITVNNSGARNSGAIVEWGLRIHYVENQ